MLSQLVRGLKKYKKVVEFAGEMKLIEDKNKFSLPQLNKMMRFIDNNKLETVLHDCNDKSCSFKAQALLCSTFATIAKPLYSENTIDVVNDFKREVRKRKNSLKKLGRAIKKMI